jgi:hypothetical protein
MQGNQSDQRANHKAERHLWLSEIKSGHIRDAIRRGRGGKEYALPSLGARKGSILFQSKRLQFPTGQVPVRCGAFRTSPFVEMSALPKAVACISQILRERRSIGSDRQASNRWCRRTRRLRPLPLVPLGCAPYIACK